MRGLLTVLGSAVVAAPLAAQGPASGAYVATLGRDTVAVESFARMGDRIVGKSAVAYPRAMLRTYTITFGPGGAVSQFEFNSGVPGAPATMHARWEYRGDSTFITFTRDTTTRQLAVATGTAHPMPFFEDLFGPWDLILQSALSGGADSGSFTTLNGRTPLAFTARREGAHGVAFTWTEWGTGYARFDPDGTLQEIDLTATTSKYLVHRVSEVNVEGTAAAWAKRPQPGLLSPRDTARIALGDAHVMIDYSRPSLRGRVMFGKLLPWGKIWRLGANAATQLITDKDLVIGRDTIPAGTYSLWSVLTPTTWELIVNKQHGQWGTEYHADSDLVHIPLTVSRPSTPLEQFTITLEPKGADSGTMRFAWEGRAGTVEFRVKE